METTATASLSTHAVYVIVVVIALFLLGALIVVYWQQQQKNLQDEMVRTESIISFACLASVRQDDCLACVHAQKTMVRDHMHDSLA